MTRVSVWKGTNNKWYVTLDEVLYPRERIRSREGIVILGSFDTVEEALKRATALSSEANVLYKLVQ